MKSGYDQFFKKAQKAAESGSPLPPRKRTIGAVPSATKQMGIPLSEFEKMTTMKSSAQRQQKASSDAMVAELRERAKQRLKARRKRKPFPIKLVASISLGLVLAGAGFCKADQIEKLVQKIEVTAVGQAYAEDKPAAAAATDKKDTAKPDEKAEASADAEKKPTYTADDIDHFAKLNDRKKELDAREEELNRMETELQQQKEALDKRLDELDKTRRGISSVLEEKVQADDKKVDNLVQMYSNMKPQQAAKAFEEMDEDLAIEILGRMKKKNAAEIMNLVKPEKVKIFTEKYAGYKSNNNGT